MISMLLLATTTFLFLPTNAADNQLSEHNDIPPSSPNVIAWEHEIAILLNGDAMPPQGMNIPQDLSTIRVPTRFPRNSITTSDGQKRSVPDECVERYVDCLKEEIQEIFSFKQ